MLVTLDKLDATRYEPLPLWWFYPDADPQRPNVTPGPALPDYSGLNPPETVNRSVAQYTRTLPLSQPMEAVYQVLTSEPRTIDELSQLCGLSYFKTRQWLTRLVINGRAKKGTERVFRKAYRWRAVARYTRAK